MDFEKVELDEAEDSLKLKAKEGTVTAVADIDENIVSQATEILIQLTHENFDSLVKIFVKLPFENNEERIGSVVRILVEKAINEPTSSSISTYTRLTHEICKNSQETYHDIFRMKIMDECRKEFQKSSTDKTDIKEIEIAIKKTNDESKKEEEIEEKRAQMEKRTRGNVNFIGELYTLRSKKLKLLPPCFMVEVVDMLLSSIDEINLECLCKLLTIVGSKLEKHLRGVVIFNAEKRKKGEGQEINFDPDLRWFDKTFKKLSELSKENSLSSHVRFALLDVLELRQTNPKRKSRRGVPEGIWRSTLAPQPQPQPQPPSDSKQPKKIIKIGDFEKIELHKVEKEWKSKRGADINDQIVIQSTGILNEFTPDIEGIVEKFLSLSFEDNDGRNDLIVRLVFEKVNDEPSISTAYAKMVHTICKKSREASNLFHKKILDQCQKEFEKTSIDEADIKEIEIEIEKTDDETKNLFLKKELMEKRTQMRRRSLENVCFIGKLYKLQMLTLRIIMEYITMLQSSMNEVNLECLCELLAFIGFELEGEIKEVETSNELKRNRGQEIKFAPEPEWFDKTFNKLYRLSKEESLSPRIRFALLDVHKLRQNNWTPRHNANVPKTIDEIRQDAIRQKQREKRPCWFQQKQSGNKHYDSGSQSSFLMPPSAWGRRPSIPELQMKSQTTIGKLQFTLPPIGGSRFEALPRVPSDVVKNIFAEYCFSKNLAETIEWTRERFRGASINQFIEILSRQIAEESKKEKQIAAGILTNSLISNKVVSKESVLKILEEGVLSDLPDIEVDAPKAVSYLSVFLVEIFHDEKNLLWLPPLGTSLVEKSMETWTNLVVAILNILKNKLGKETVIDYYKEVSNLPTGDIEWLEKSDSQDFSIWQMNFWLRS